VGHTVLVGGDENRLRLIWETSSGEVLERWRNGCGEYCEGHAWNWV